MNFKELLAKIDKKGKYSSPQYEKSREFIRLKLENDLTQFEMAKAIGVSFEKYIEMESCSLEISVEQYEEALLKFNEYLLKKAAYDKLNDTSANKLVEVEKRFSNFAFKTLEVEQDIDDAIVINEKSAFTIYDKNRIPLKVKKIDQDNNVMNPLTKDIIYSPLLDNASISRVSPISIEQMNFLNYPVKYQSLIEDNVYSNIILDNWDLSEMDISSQLNKLPTVA